MVAGVRYTGSIVISFDFDVPGDEPGDSREQRIEDTAAAAGEVVARVRDKIATDELAGHLTRFPNRSVESSVLPQEV